MNSGSSGSVAPVSALGAHGCTTVCSVLAFPILRWAHTVALPGLELESALSPHPVWLLRLGGLPIFTAPDSGDELSLCLGLVLRGPVSEEAAGRSRVSVPSRQPLAFQLWQALVMLRWERGVRLPSATHSRPWVPEQSAMSSSFVGSHSFSYIFKY